MRLSFRSRWLIGLFAFSFTLSLFSASPAEAARCRPEGGRALKIGCPYNRCGSSVRNRLSFVAFLQGYRVKFVDLTAYSDTREALNSVDAVLFTGGADIDPEYYVTDALPPEVKAELEAVRHLYVESAEGNRRDPFEFPLAQTILSDPEHRELPVLGICRGMQMLTVASGIPLTVDIRAEIGIPNPKKRFQSFTTPVKNTRMDRIFPSGAKLAWENHHQALRYSYFQEYADRHPNIRVTAFSNGGRLPEALEYTDRPVMGVQFHPETSSPRIAHGVFGWLLNEACERTKK